MKIKRLFDFKYPKIMLFVLAIILAYTIFNNTIIQGVISHLGSWSYLGIFIAGMLFTFGFTAPFAAGFFITLNPQNIWLAGIIGGIGAMFSDLLIFRFIRISFRKEFNMLKKEKISRKIESMINKTVGNKIKIYLMYIFAGFLIASPLPDEAGVIMLAGLTKIKQNILAIASFILNTIGIIILLYL